MQKYGRISRRNHSQQRQPTYIVHGYACLQDRMKQGSHCWGHLFQEQLAPAVSLMERPAS
eukprot:8216031-Prorocentrum_lima.AAC.1